MLVLSRKKNESIIIQDNIEIIILDNQQGKIKIGINAPRDVHICRKEIYNTPDNKKKPKPVSKEVLL